MGVIVANKRTWRGPGPNQFTLYIGRPSSFGNPFKIGDHGTREEVVQRYYDEFFVPMWNRHEFFRRILWALAIIAAQPGFDVVLICWCAPELCHGDVIRRCIEHLIQLGVWDARTQPLIVGGKIQ